MLSRTQRSVMIRATPSTNIVVVDQEETLDVVEHVGFRLLSCAIRFARGSLVYSSPRRPQEGVDGPSPIPAQDAAGETREYRGPAARADR